VLSWPILHGLFRLRVRGSENVPASGGFVLSLQPPLELRPVAARMPLWPHRWLRFMAKAELYWWPATYVLDTAGAFQVPAWLGDREAIETAVRPAREGNVVVMFPEGHARAKGSSRSTSRGATRAPRESRWRPDVPLVPAPSPAPTGCSGSDRCGSPTAPGRDG
jgi:1-acyl-sn-glycerol-3-phosphate acyltransferase